MLAHDFGHFWPATSTIFLHYRLAPTFNRCHQHPKMVTTLIQQHNCHQHLASKRGQGDGKDALR